jgi:hypothetical protein
MSPVHAECKALLSRSIEVVRELRSHGRCFSITRVFRCGLPKKWLSIFRSISHHARCRESGFRRGTAWRVASFASHEFARQTRPLGPDHELGRRRNELRLAAPWQSKIFRSCCRGEADGAQMCRHRRNAFKLKPSEGKLNSRARCLGDSWRRWFRNQPSDQRTSYVWIS